MCGMMMWDGQPGNHTFWLPPKHGASPCSATLHECQTKQMPRRSSELLPWRTGGDHQDALVLHGWRLSSRTWHPRTFPWMEQLTWLRIVHSGDWYLRLVLHTPSGAWQKRSWCPLVFWHCWMDDTSLPCWCTTVSMDSCQPTWLILYSVLVDFLVDNACIPHRPHHVVVPLTRLSAFSNQAFSITAVRTCSSLPSEVTSSNSFLHSLPGSFWTAFTDLDL